MKRDVLYCIGDLHLTNKNSKFKTVNGVSDLLRAQKQFCTDVSLQAKQEEDLSNILFLGDWSDYTNFDPVMQEYSNACFQQLCNHHAKNFFVTGNHTVYGSSNAYSVLGAKKELNIREDAEVFDEPEMWTQFGDESDHDICFVMIPYQENYQEIVRQIKTYNEEVQSGETDSVNILCFHFPTMGAKLDNLVEAKSGVTVKPEHVDNFDLCIGGDFHRPQEVFEGFHYVGAPFTLKFGENDCERGFVKIIIEDGDISLERVPNHQNYEMLRVEGFDGFQQLREEERDWSKMILKVEGEISERERTKLQEVREEFYRLILPPIGKSSVDDEDESVEMNVNKMEVFEQNDDVEKVKENIDDLDISSDLKEETMRIFKEEISF